MHVNKYIVQLRCCMMLSRFAKYSCAIVQSLTTLTDSDASLVHDDDDWISVSDSDESGGDGSSEDSRYEGFFSLLRGAALDEPLVCEDVAVRAIRAGSSVEFSPDEVERHLQRAVEELRIMRSRGNVYFV